MKRQILLSSLCLLFVAAVGWADAGFWFGPKGLYFHPSNANIQRFYKTFWGWGGEAGWAYKYFEGSLEVSYVQAKGKIIMDETEVGGGVVGQFWEHLSALTVTPRVALRLRPRRTPYVGVGVGYHKMSWGFQNLKQPFPGEISSAMLTEVFGGFDYRLVRWCGARGELGYRMPEAVERDKIWLYANYKDMRGWKASLGVYLSR